MLTVADVHAGYEQTEVLHGIDIEVGEGELVTVLGANGAGKTTLLRVISGLLEPTKGEVRLEGEDLTGAQPHERCRRGLVQVPEGRKLFPAMSVEENLRLGAMPGDAMQRGDETITQVYDRFPVLADRAKQLAGTLSGGEQQQLAIGRALMGLPRILLLDEPTQGLAPVLADDVLETVSELHGDGLTVLLVSQEVAASLDISDRAYVFENGTVAMAGSAAEIAARDDVREAYLGL